MLLTRVLSQPSSRARPRVNPLPSNMRSPSKLGRGDRQPHVIADIAADIERLEPRKHGLGEQGDVAPCKLVRHAAIAEDPDHSACVSREALILGETNFFRTPAWMN